MLHRRQTMFYTHWHHFGCFIVWNSSLAQTRAHFRTIRNRDFRNYFFFSNFSYGEIRLFYWLSKSHTIYHQLNLCSTTMIRIQNTSFTPYAHNSNEFCPFVMCAKQTHKMCILFEPHSDFAARYFHAERKPVARRLNATLCLYWHWSQSFEQYHIEFTRTLLCVGMFGFITSVYSFFVVVLY